MRPLVFAAVVLSLVGTAPAMAASCKDPKTGKFMKCPDKPAPKATRCKAANGKFAKCGTPGAKPI